MAYNSFPYVNMHELNLDYLLNKSKEVQANVEASAGSASAAASSAAAAANSANASLTYSRNSANSAAAAEASAADSAESARIAVAAAGDPITFTAASQLTNTSKIYVYIGQTGTYTYGHWYYYAGGAWIDGGVYGTWTTDAELDPDSTNAVQNKVIYNAVNDLQDNFNACEFSNQKITAITSWLQKSSNSINNNKDGTYTIGTSDYGTVIFKHYLLPPGCYAIYGVPAGFSFLSTDTSPSGSFFTNDKNEEKIISFTEETDCYLGYRNTARPTEPFVIRPYLKESQTATAYETINSHLGSYSNLIKMNPEPLDIVVSGTGSGINYSNGRASQNELYSFSNYVDVSEFVSITYKKIKVTTTSTVIGIAFYDSNKTYVSGVSAVSNQSEPGYDSALSAVTIPDRAVYVRFSMLTDTATYGEFLAYGNTEIVTAIQKNYTDFIDTVNLNELNYKNLVGMEANVYYPVNIQPGSDMVISTADGQAIGQSELELYFYDADKTQLNFWSFSGSRTSRHITSPADATTHYLRWNHAPVREVQVELNITKTEYVPYHYPLGKRITDLDYTITTNIAESIFNGELYTEPYDWQTPVTAYGALFKNKNNVETFAFFTDPHVMGFTGRNEPAMHEYIKKLSKVFRSVPCCNFICGGDWLNNDTIAGEACYRLGYIKALANNMLCNCKLMVGNHDTNYQGKADASSDRGTGRLTDSTIAALMFYDTDTKKAYYSFDGIRSKCYVMDTGIEHSSMLAYDWEQIAWLAEKLLSDNPEHGIIYMHIITNNGNVQTNAGTIGTLIEAYNGRNSVTLNGITYDFSTCTGKIEFCVGGHTHIDSNGMLGGVPYFITATNSYTSDVPLVDLALADYDNGLLHLIRVGGSGTDRTISLITGELVTN